MAAQSQQSQNTEQRELSRREMIVLSLKNRGLELTQREINLAILYSCCDSAYHRRDDTHTLTNEGCTAAIDKAYQNFLKYSTPNTSQANIA